MFAPYTFWTKRQKIVIHTQHCILVTIQNQKFGGLHPRRKLKYREFDAATTIKSSETLILNDDGESRSKEVC